MNKNLYGGFINKDLYSQIQPPPNSTIYTEKDGLTKNTIGMDEYISIFSKLKNHNMERKEDDNMEDEKIYNLIISNIPKYYEKYRIATEREITLKKIFFVNLEIINNELYSELICLINKHRNNIKVNIANILPPPKKFKTMTNSDVLQYINDNDINLNTIYKLPEFRDLLRIITDINKKFAQELKLRNNDLLLESYKNKHNDYMGFLLKIIPFLKNNKDGKQIDMFNLTHNNKYVVLFELDDIIYNIYQDLDLSLDEPIIYYLINSEYDVKQIDISTYDVKNIVSTALIKVTIVDKNPYLKNILITKKNIQSIMKSIEYLIKYYSNDVIIKELFDYMFINLGIETVPKKSVISNIFNLFSLTGKINLMYNLFGEKCHYIFADEYHLFLRDIICPIEQSDINYSNYRINKADLRLLLKDIPNQKQDKLLYCEKMESIIQNIKENPSPIQIIFLNKIKLFISNNINLFRQITDYMDYKEYNFRCLIYCLNKIKYDDIPIEIVEELNNIKDNLLNILVDSRTKILDENINIKYLIHSYNFFDLFESSKHLDNKLSTISISDIENQLSKLNSIILRDIDLTWYYLLLDIVNCRRIIINAAIRLKHVYEFILASYLLDIINSFRLTQFLEVPFNINIMTHEYRKYRTTDSYLEKSMPNIKNIYSYLEPKFKLFLYGYNSRNTTDCSETVILNMINYLIWDNDYQKLRADWLPKNTNKQLVDFYSQNTRLDSINLSARSRFNEIFYGHTFILQNCDYFNLFNNSDVTLEDKYRVYSVTESYSDDSIPILSRSHSYVNFIFDEAGNLLPDKKVITYTGWRIRPGYISFIRLFNLIFGYNKISTNYEEKYVMRKFNKNALKDILLTFRNPNISNILSDFTIKKGTNMDDVFELSFSDIDINLEWYHTTNSLKDTSSSYGMSNTSIYRALSNNLRYFVDNEYNLLYNESVKMDTFNNELTLLRDSDILREKIENIFENCLETNKIISNTIINYYKVLWLPEQSHLVLNVLPSLDYNETEFFCFLEKFEGKIKFGQDIFLKPVILSKSLLKIIIRVNHNNVDAELDKYGNRLIHIIYKSMDLELFEILIRDYHANFTLTDIFGNNIFHMSAYKKEISNVYVDCIKQIIKNDDLCLKLITTKNKSGYYPIIFLYNRKNKVFYSLLPTSINDLLNVFYNSVNKILLGNFMMFLGIFEIIINKLCYKIQVGNSENEIFTLVKNIVRFIVNMVYKYNNNIEHLIDFLKKINGIVEIQKIFDSNEISYINYIFLQMQTEIKYNLKLTQENITQILEVSKNYVVNPWILFNDFDSIDITFTLIQRNYFKDVRIGCIEDTREKGLIKYMLAWVSENKNIELIKTNRDSDGNTILHYLANGMKVNLDLYKEYLKMFDSFIKKKNFDILTTKNNKGWSPIDILSYVPCYTRKLFYSKLSNILAIFKVLYRFYSTFEGDIYDHKIVLTRYFIEQYYINIYQTKKIKNKRNQTVEETTYYNFNIIIELLNLLNIKLFDHPIVTIDMLCKTYREFNIHEYIYIFKKVTNFDISDISASKYVLMENGDFSLKTTGAQDSAVIKSSEMNKIICLPKLYKKYYRLFNIRQPLNNYILSDLKRFTSEILKSEYSSVDPFLDKSIEKMDPLFKPDDISISSAIAIESKYLTYGKDYKKLYNKYKQKYIALKNKLQ